MASDVPLSSLFSPHNPLGQSRSGAITSTNLFNPAGDLIEIAYSDATPHVLLSNYDRAGRPRSVTDVRGERTLAYDLLGRVVSDSGAAGPFAGINLLSLFHRSQGLTNLQLQIPGQSTLNQTYDYQATGRLQSGSYGGHSAHYAYLADSDLLRTNTFKNGGATRLTSTYDWEFGSRLQSVRNRTSDIFNSQSYDYDDLNRRERVTLYNQAYWQYAYNDRDEVTSGKRFWADDSPVAGQQFEYDYDPIGNRTTARSGGDANGQDLRLLSYEANALNQYTNILTPGFKEVFGIAWVPAIVTVNGQATDRRAEYYRRELSLTNSAGPLWQPVSVVASGNTNGGHVLFPPYTQTPVYDPDGNLVSDGLWNYAWDAENRLSSIESVAGLESAARRKLEFSYDFLGRRVARKTYQWTGSWTLSANVRYVYDGWNLVAELNATNNLPIRSYLWGHDLSGTFEEAGGIGGLLMVRDHAADAYHFVAYDGHGNVVGLVNANDQSLSAQYEYSPFGETLRATGPMAKANPFRFSTKFTDQETDLVDYGHRYYSPAMGRWINRDPIEEEGGLHLFAFLANNPVNALDYLGRNTLAEEESAIGAGAGLAGQGASQALGILQRVRAMANANNAMVKLANAMEQAATVAGAELQAVEGFLMSHRLVIAGMAAGGRVTTVLGRFNTDMHQFVDPVLGRMNQWGMAWQQLGYNILSMPQNWSRAQQLAGSFRWLSEAVARNDKIYLGSKVGAEFGTKTYELELMFLRALGYVRQGDYMVLK